MRNIHYSLLFIFSFCLLFATITNGQAANNKSANKINYNAAYLELGGNGLLISVNYERRLLTNIDLCARIGAGIYGTDKKLTIPFGFDYNLRVSRHSFIDFGFGVTYTKAEADFYVLAERNRNGYYKKDANIIPIPSAQYKYVSNTGFLLKAGVFLPIRDFGPIPYIGISLGKCF